MLASTAAAAGETEPNNEIVTANGPLSPTSYSGTLTAPVDEDWYSVQLFADQQVTLSTSFSGACDFTDAPKVYVQGKRGPFVASVDTEGNETSASFTTPATGAYYVIFEGETDNDCNYSFELTPSSAFAPAPAPLPKVPLSEPDDLVSEAHQISAEMIYTGAIQTINDVDRVAFSTLEHKTVDVELVAVDCGGHIEGSIYEGTGEAEYVGGVYGDTDEWGLNALKTKSGGTFEVQIKAGGTEPERAIGCGWQFLISPTSALGTAPSTGHSADPCRVAGRVLARRRYHLHRLERTLRFASPRRRAAIRRQIRSGKQAVKAAKQEVRAKCPKS